MRQTGPSPFGRPGSAWSAPTVWSTPKSVRGFCHVDAKRGERARGDHVITTRAGAAPPGQPIEQEPSPPFPPRNVPTAILRWRSHRRCGCMRERLERPLTPDLARRSARHPASGSQTHLTACGRPRPGRSHPGPVCRRGGVAATGSLPAGPPQRWRQGVAPRVGRGRRGS